MEVVSNEFAKRIKAAERLAALLGVEAKREVRAIVADYENRGMIRSGGLQRDLDEFAELHKYEWDAALDTYILPSNAATVQPPAGARVATRRGPSEIWSWYRNLSAVLGIPTVIGTLVAIPGGVLGIAELWVNQFGIPTGLAVVLVVLPVLLVLYDAWRLSNAGTPAYAAPTEQAAVLSPMAEGVPATRPKPRPLPTRAIPAVPCEEISGILMTGQTLLDNYLPSSYTHVTVAAQLQRGVIPTTAADVDIWEHEVRSVLQNYPRVLVQLEAASAGPSGSILGVAAGLPPNPRPARLRRWLEALERFFEERC